MNVVTLMQTVAAAIDTVEMATGVVIRLKGLIESMSQDTTITADQAKELNRYVNQRFSKIAGGVARDPWEVVQPNPGSQYDAIPPLNPGYHQTR